MSIILQNDKNLILNIFKSTFINNVDSVINNFDSINTVNNYINLVSSYDDFMYHTLRISFIKY